MGRSRVFSIIIILLIISVTSNANLLFNYRKLADLVSTQSNNSSSDQISVSNTSAKGEKEVNSGIVNDKKSEIGKEKPENPEGSNDPPKPGQEELNSIIVNNGSSKAENQKPKDPQVSGNVPKDTKDPNSTTVNDGSSKAGSEQTKDAQGSNDPSKAGSKETKSDAVDGESSKGEKEKHKGPQPKRSNDTTKLDPDGPKNDNVTADSHPPVEKKNEKKKNVDDTVTENDGKKNVDDTVKENEEKNNVEDTVKENVNTNDSCHGATKMCRVEQSLVACIQAVPNGSAKLFLVVQNEGEKRVRVNLNTQPPLDSYVEAIKIAEHQSKKIDISSILGKGAEIVLNTGDGSCKLQLDRRVSVENIMQQVSLYSKRVTPIYGAYFFFLVALLFGGTWACCKLRKKRLQDGVPYQELEMGIPVSTSAANVVTADGWDQDWDDDWDEENAVKSPGGRTFGNISANGLTSRSSKRDGWENDWDD